MAKLTPESFLNIVRESKLLTKDKIKSLITEMQGSSVDLTSTSTIASWLVEQGHLTDWQVDKLKQARHKGFFLGKYRLLRLLGKGGMSSVYLAEHTLMRRRCAIKVLPIKKVHDSSYLARFYREAQAVASLDHPNIVRAYDIDHEVEKEQEIHFLVMEHVKGLNMQELIKANGPLSFELAVEYSRQAARGLDHAHRSGLIHRDVKPGNLLVDETGTVKVLDLGLARFAEVTEENPLTVAHDERVLGTADYLSPEQALDSHSVDARADIYSLGCTAYFTLTGHPPFNEGTIAQRLLWHQTKEPPSVTVSRADTPESLAAIIKKMIEKNPDDRFQSMSELAETLGHWLDVKASPEWKEAHGQANGFRPAATRNEFPTPPIASRPPELSAFIARDPEPASNLNNPSDSGFNAFLSNLGDQPAAAEGIAPAAPISPVPEATPQVEPQIAIAVTPPTAVVAAPVVAPPIAAPPIAAPPIAAPPIAAPPIAAPPPIAAVVAVPAPVTPAAPAPIPAAAVVEPLAPVAAPVVLETPPQATHKVADQAVPNNPTPATTPPTVPAAPDVAAPVVSTPAEDLGSPTVPLTASPVTNPSTTVDVGAVGGTIETDPTKLDGETLDGEQTVLEVVPAAQPIASPPMDGDSAPPQFEGFAPDTDPSLDPTFIQKPSDDDSMGGFPSLFGAPDTMNESPNLDSNEVAEMGDTAAYIPAPDSNHEQPTIIGQLGLSEFSHLPSQSDSDAHPAPATGAGEFPANQPASPGQFVPATPAVALPNQPVAAPQPADNQEFLTPMEPVEDTASAFGNFGDNNLGEPNFGNFTEPAAPVSNQPPPATTAPLGQDPVQATTVGFNAPEKFGAPNFGGPQDLAEFGVSPLAAAQTTQTRGPRAPKKSPVALIAGALVVVGIGIGCYFAFTGDKENKPQDKQTQKGGKKKNNSKGKSGTVSNGRLKLNFAVGPNGDFKTIREALDRIKKDSIKYGSLPLRTRIFVYVEGGNTYNESISIDSNYPRGIHIIAQGERAKLKSSGGPAVKAVGVEFFGLENFEIDAGNASNAIELGGFMKRSRLLDLKVQGYKENGLLGKGLAGVSSDFVVLESIEFKPNGSSANGMTFTNGTAPSGRVRIQGCRFIGPTNQGIHLEVGVNFFEIRECIFDRSNVGVQLGKGLLTWRNIIFTNNTFYQGKTGVAFGSMPTTQSSDLALHRNLFAGLSGPELVIEAEFDDKKFDRVFSTVGGVDSNYSDRQAKPDIAAGERDIVIRDERRIGKISFASTNASSPDFLAIKNGSPYARTGGPKFGSKIYVGAVPPQ